MKIRQVFNYADGGDIFSLQHSQGIEKMAFSESSLILSGGTTLTSHIRQLFNKPDSYNDRIEAHPDFVNLSDDEEKKQYVVSVFADIQGSTNLVFKYDLPTVRVIKNRILSIAIEFFQGCDGHFHRLQGDAIFAYQENKNMLTTTEKKLDKNDDGQDISITITTFKCPKCGSFIRNDEVIEVLKEDEN